MNGSKDHENRERAGSRIHRTAGAPRPGSSRAGASPGFGVLRDLELNPADASRLHLASRHAAGDPSWRRRKIAEAREVLGLGQIAPNRLQVELLDLHHDLRAVVRMSVPVPCRPPGAADIVVAREALLGLRYPRAAVHVALPGTGFLHILEPRHVFHASVGQPDQPCCLGPRLPAGVRVRSLLLMAYVGLAMQEVQVDELDAAGVFNWDAARWWQANLWRTPLSRIPFLAPDSPEESEQEGS